jgi:hypothetical protein
MRWRVKGKAGGLGEILKKEGRYEKLDGIMLDIILLFSVLPRL